jgi:glutathione S-transferase
MLKIYGDYRSGNCYKIKLVCALLDIDYQWIAIDIMKGEASSPAMLAKNPNGKIPFIEMDDGFVLTESNAIINYLGANSGLYPSDSRTTAQIQQWQFFEQYSHEPYIAVARFIKFYQGMPESRLAEFEAKQTGGTKALQLMEKHLESSSFLVGDSMTTADIALYAYTHVAHEGGFELNNYPAIRSWINRIQSLPMYKEMID